MSRDNQYISLGETQAIRYRLPSCDRFNEPTKDTNAFIIIDATNGLSKKLRGLGESQFRGVETGDRGIESWDFLSSIVKLLPGKQIDVTSRQQAVQSIRSILDLLKAEALKHKEQVQPSKDNPTSFKSRLKEILPKNQSRTSHDPVQPYGGVLFGLETALLDLAAQALNMSVMELISGLKPDTNTTVQTIPLHLIRGTQYDQISEQLREIVAGQSPQLSLWLDFGRRISVETASNWLDRFPKRKTQRLGNEVVLYRPLKIQDRDSYPKLLNEAKSRLPKNAQGRKVAIAPDRLSGAARTGLDSNYSEVYYEVLRPTGLGSLLDTYAEAERLASHGITNMYIVERTNTGPVAHAALAQLASSIPQVKALVSSSAPAGTTPINQIGLNVSEPWETLLTAEGVRYISTVPESQNGPHQFNHYPELPYLQTLGPNGTKGHLMEREALSLGLKTVRYSKGAFTATDGVKPPMLFKWSRSPISSAVSLAICTHKEATRMRLHEAGIPVPRGRTFRNGDFATAREFAQMLGYPVVVKPAMGVRGIGVVAGIADETELDQAFEQLTDSKLGSQDFIVEKHVHGKDYRIVVVGDEVIAAILREPASVIGDGQRTIAELILRKNGQRRLNPHLWGRPIIYDLAAVYQLEREGLTVESVPDKGRLVMLSNSCSLSQGGDSFDVLDELHPSIKEASVAAVKAIPELAFCGVDFLLEDHTKPLAAQEAGICELNAHAAIGNCEYPLYGKPRQVAAKFMDLCVEELGFQVTEQRANKVSVMIQVRGRVTGVGYRAWLERLATEYGIKGWVRNVNPRRVEAVLSGETMAVTALVAAAVLGPTAARPTSVTTDHVSEPRTNNFSIVSKRPKVVRSVIGR